MPKLTRNRIDIWFLFNVTSLLRRVGQKPQRFSRWHSCLAYSTCASSSTGVFYLFVKIIYLVLSVQKKDESSITIHSIWFRLAWSWCPIVSHAIAFVPPQGGDICLPGGMEEDGDDTLVNTAIREAEEEIGTKPSQIEVVLLNWMRIKQLSICTEHSTSETQTRSFFSSLTFPYRSSALYPV